MKGKFQRRVTRFWSLGGLSVVLVLIAYQIILKFLFPTFASRVCVEGYECPSNLLEGYVSLLTLAIVVGGIVFAAWEYLRQESQLSFQIYESIHEKMTDPAEEAARRWIIKNIQTSQGKRFYKSVEQGICQENLR